MITRAALAFLVWLGAVSAPLPTTADESPQPDSSTTLLAGRVVLPDGSLQDNAVVVIKNGKIKRVANRTEFAKVKVHDLGDDVVVCPGMIDLFAMPGVVGQTVEDTEVVEPEASPETVIDPTHKDFRHALRSGITTVLVGPAATNLVNGVCVTTRTHVDGQLDVLRSDGPLLLAFGDGVWRADRAPTSRSGALLELRELVAAARKGEAHPRVNAAVAGKLDAWVACTSKQDVVSVHHVLGEARKHFGLIHSKDVLDAVDVIKDLRQPVVIGPYSMTTSQRELTGAALLADAGVEVAFRAGFPIAGAQSLRLSAALAVRSGMDPAAGRRAITVAPAKVAGVDQRVGSIARGKDADLVLFSHDPLRMDAHVLEVYVLGQRVYSAKHQAKSSEGPMSLEGAQP